MQLLIEKQIGFATAKPARVNVHAKKAYSAAKGWSTTTMGAPLAEHIGISAVISFSYRDCLRPRNKLMRNSPRVSVSYTTSMSMIESPLKSPGTMLTTFVARVALSVAFLQRMKSGSIDSTATQISILPVASFRQQMSTSLSALKSPQAYGTHCSEPNVLSLTMAARPTATSHASSHSVAVCTPVRVIRLDFVFLASPLRSSAWVRQRILKARGVNEKIIQHGPEMGNCYLKKKSITNYITNCFYTKQLALSIEVIGLKKPITQLLRQKHFAMSICMVEN